MLFLGVIPMMKERRLVEEMDDLASRRIQLGSTNIVMDYAARIYILNGLGRLKTENDGSLEELLLKQFC
jgi:hypothetical protein